MSPRSDFVLLPSLFVFFFVSETKFFFSSLHWDRQFADGRDRLPAPDEPEQRALPDRPPEDLSARVGEGQTGPAAAPDDPGQHRHHPALVPLLRRTPQLPLRAQRRRPHPGRPSFVFGFFCSPPPPHPLCGRH